MQRYFTLLSLSLFAWTLGQASALHAADVRLDVEFGWGGAVEAGHWAPVFITASGKSTQNVRLNVEWATGGAHIMRVHQDMTIGPLPRTFSLLLPIRGIQYRESSFILSDASSGKTLAAFPKEGADPTAVFGELPDGKLIGASGRRTGLASLQMAWGNPRVGYLASQDIPESAMGFDGLCLLVLNEPNFNPAPGTAGFSDVQQSAMLDWVRAGGTLLLWPGEAGLGSTGPLLRELPARVASPSTVQLSNASRAWLDLPNRFKKLTLYALEPAAESQKISLLPDGELLAYSRAVGLGHIVLAPLNLTDFPIEDAARGKLLWRPLLEGTDALRLMESPATNKNFGWAPGYGMTANAASDDESRELAAETHIADALADIPGAGTINFTYIGGLLVGLLVLVGPLDWLVLRKLGLQPWTWVTTTGWIGLFTFGALLAAHLAKSGSLTYRTIHFVDQVQDGAIAVTDMAAIYAPQSRSYQFKPTADGWWRPYDARWGYSDSSYKFDSDYHQNQSGNLLEETYLNIWSTQIFRGDAVAAGPAAIKADLHWIEAGSHRRLEGTLTNLTDLPLQHVVVRSDDAEGKITIAASGGASLQDGVAAHATTPIVVQMTPVQPNADESGVTGQPLRSKAAGELTDQDLRVMASKINARQGRRMVELVKTGRFVLVYAASRQLEPTVALSSPADAGEHWTSIRALVPVH